MILFPYLAGHQKNSSLTSHGSFLICVTTDEVNILQGLSPRLLNDSKASLTSDDSGCPVLQVGLLSTLTLPLQDFLTDGYAAIAFYAIAGAKAYFDGLMWVVC